MDAINRVHKKQNYKERFEMVEEQQNKQSRLQAFVESIKNGIFSTMLELLKEKKAGKWFASILMLIMFVQLVGYLFDKDNDFPWKDDYLLDALEEIVKFARLLPTIEESGSTTFFYILYFFAVIVIFFIILLFVYTIYSIHIQKFYFLWPVNLLKAVLTFLYWILFCPFMEVFLSIFNCDGEKHSIDTNMNCYQGMHVFFVILSVIFIILLLLICVVTALFFNETQPIAEDAFARTENSHELMLLIYRTGVVFFSTFVYNDVGNWIFICLFLAASILFAYQYFTYVPYFDSFTSIFWGSLICNYCWFSLNALLMMVINVYGHIIIICIGIPIIAGLVKNLRELRIQHLVLLNMEKMKTEVDAITQIITVQQMIKAANMNQVEDVTLIGIVNLHVLECQNSECPCKNEADLFDAATGKFSQRDVGYHKDPIFLNHFVKRLYEDSQNKFMNSPLLNIAFSYYLFETMKNVHAALLELNLSSKKKPSLQQQFTIFRYKYMIENHIKAESTQAKDIYSQLTNVIEFERLVGELQKSIEKVCNFQIEFWSQIANQLPDLNILHDLGNKIYLGTQEAEEAWNKLCKINPNYPKALLLYGNYMNEIKNHNQIGFELIDKAKVNTNKKSLDELIKSSDILFADDTVVIHVSGNKESAGKIVQTNQSLTKIFGYSKTEVMGHGVHILMPSLFAKRHLEFLEKFFKTGHKTVFNTERFFYGLHRNGFCFSIKMLVKQMPSLQEGIQYVGMIRQSQSDCEYIITDMRGVIDCFSSGITSMLNMAVNLFKESDINIQILAPELIKIFSSTDKKRTLLEKFKEPGGQKLTFIVPKDFSHHAQSDSKKNAREIGKGMQAKSGMNPSIKKGKNPLYRDFNKDLNKHNGVAQKAVTTDQLLKSDEYIKWEIRQSVKCEIQDLVYGYQHKDIEALKLRILKVTGISMKRAGSNIDQSSEGGEDYAYGLHSNASFEWKDSKGVRPTEELQKEEIKRNILNLVVNQPEPLVLEEKKDDEVGKREETKTTEKVAGNTLTTESRVETLEAKTVLRVQMGANPKPAETRKTGKEVFGGDMMRKEEKEEIKINSPVAGIDTSQLQQEKEQEKVSEPSTPRMELGNLKGPESLAAGSHIAEENTIQPQEESLFESESGKSTGKAEAKIAVKEEKKGHRVQSSGRLPGEDKKSERPQFGTSIDSDKKYQGNLIDSGRKKEEKKEEEIKEDVVPLDKKQIDIRLARGEQPNYPKVPSMLDEAVASVGRKGEEKKTHTRDSAAVLAKVKYEGEVSEVQPTEEIKEPFLPPMNILNAFNEEDENRNVEKDRKMSRSSEKGGAYSRGIIEETKRPIHRGRSMRKNKFNSKIITNPVYDTEGNDLIEIPEYKMTEEEMKVRKSLFAFQKKKNKEKKNEEKKEDKKEAAKDEDEEDYEGEEEGEEEGEDPKENKKDKKEPTEDDEDDNQDTQSSVTSGSTGSTMRSFYSLRAAIDEKYIPPSIRNLSCSANIVFLLLLGIAIVYFVMQFTLYDNINLNIKNINYSEKRLNNLIDINLQITKMMLITADAVQHRDNTSLTQTSSWLYGDTTTALANFNVCKSKLKLQATWLKDAQTDLSLKSTELSSESLAKINPSNVVLSYKTVPGMPENYTYTIWQAIMEVVVSSYRIATMTQYEVNDTEDATVYFVTHNSLNNIIINLEISSDAIMDETESSREFNLMIFLILLCVASFALLISTVLLVPVINKVKKNKQEVLALFMHIKKGDANEELTKCRKFLGTFQSNQETEMIAVEGEEGQQEGAEDEPENSAGHMRKLEKNKFGTSRRKYKMLVLNLGFTFFKFIFLILIMEGYFIMSYFLSSTFLDRVSSLTKELRQLISRLPTHSFLLLVEKLSIFKNYDLTIKGSKAESYVSNLYDQLYDGEEELLDMFTDNHDFHSDNYNDNFNNIIYSNVCKYISEFVAIQSTCEAFNQGILQKGIYSTVIKYWDFLRQLNHDYSESSRTSADHTD